MTSTLASAFPAAPLTTVVIVAALLLAAALGVLAFLDKSVPTWALGGILLLELGLLVMAVWSVIAWIGGDGPAEPVVFFFYLLSWRGGVAASRAAGAAASSRRRP